MPSHPVDAGPKIVFRLKGEHQRMEKHSSVINLFYRLIYKGIYHWYCHRYQEQLRVALPIYQRTVF